MTLEIAGIAGHLAVRGAPRLPRWLALLAVAMAARLVTFGSPNVHVDAEFYYSKAQEMARGALPYVDIWGRKLIVARLAEELHDRNFPMI